MISQLEKKEVIISNQTRVIELLEKMKPQLALCLPKHMSVDRVCRIALTEFRKNPMLMECEPMSFIAAVMVASQLGLEIGILGSSYLVPFKNRTKNIVECNFIPGYRGLIDLARRSGNIISISAEIVYKKDFFDFEKGLNEKLIHKPKLIDKGEMIAAYAVAKLKDGGSQFIVMSKQEIDEVKNKAKAQYGPWISDYCAMAQKTVIRRLFKWLPSSVEMQNAAILDEHSEIGIQDIRGTLKEGVSPSLMISDTIIEYLGDDKEELNKETSDIKSQANELSKSLSEYVGE